MLTYGLTRDRPVRPRKLRFGILSAEEVRKMSVCQITETTLYYRGLPASGGLLDPLLGSVDRRHLCASCMRDARTCQGHNGHIELSYPVYHIGFVDTVLKVLRSTCFCCSRVSLTEEEHQHHAAAPGDRRSRLGSMHTLLRGRKTCLHCGMARPTFTRVALGIRCDWPADMEWGSEEERLYCTAPFTAREALSILRYISDDDARLLGFDPELSHPRAMILQAMAVPPPCTRPAIYSSEGSRSRGQNDLTVRLLEILKRSQELHAALDAKHWKDVTQEAFTPDTMERLAKLQYEVYALVNGSLRIARPGGAHTRSSTTNQKSLSDRLKGKEGRLRGNLMGKRVDMSARAVITPDAYFDSDRVGIPYDIAKRLTVPVTTNSANIRMLTERVRRGADDLHGAQTVVGVDGVVTHLSTCRDRDSLVLRPGDVVERHLADEDVVVFNRQPSLHKHSMSCHRVRLMPGHTFRVSLVVTSQYNADFDGDEMNVHVPQSAAARAECAMLMAIGQNIIGSQSRPVMGIVQDSCLGVHLLTQPDTLFDHAHACRIVGALRHTPRALPPPAVTLHGGAATRRWWTGKQIFSMLFPRDFYHEPEGDVFAKVREWDDASLPVVVRGGKLLCGILRKAQVGSGAGSFVDVLTRDHGNVACMRFFGDCQRMTHAFLLQRDHHVGVRDVMLSREGQERVRERLAKASDLCEEIQREVLDAPAEVAAKAERAILRILSKSLMQTGGIVSECLDESNAIRRMVTAGSKGSVINLGQICAALGQQSLEGARIVAEKGDRTLPCFAPHDLSLASRGMVLNSFALGLSPAEMFYHGVGGREGLVDTAVKTSQSGYLQRRMNKSMEDARVRGDGTVRNASDEVLNFRWGSDGLHPARLERAKLGLLSEPEDAIRARMTPAEAAVALDARAKVLRVKMHTLNAEFDTRVLLPFHPSRVRNRIAREGAVDEAARVDPAVAERRALAFAASTSPAVAAAVLDTLCTSRVAAMDRDAHARLLDDLEGRLAAAAAVVGDSVGCLAAQSVGEPCTQMTLNSVDWTTTMALCWTGPTPPPAPAEAEVGAFIDALIAERPEACQIQPDGKTIYLPLPPGSAVALSPDKHGNMKWTELEAVTRHPPINKDGSNTLVEVTTDSGRKVTVTKGKSLLVEREGKLVEIDGDEVAVGDRVPVVRELPAAEHQDTLNLHTVFRETEVVFTNTMIEAMEAVKHDRHWFLKGGFKDRSCYARSDALRDAVKTRPGLLEPDKVVGTCGAYLPMRIPLDREFGFFVGAFLAEGCLTDHQVHISNVDPAYREAARVWPDRHGIHSHTTDEKHQYKNNGTSISIMFHSTVLVKIMRRTCGKLSAGKRVPGFALAAPDDFVRGLLDGYISGDGCIQKKCVTMSASSRSQKLRDGIALLMTRFGIGCRLTKTLAHSQLQWTTEEDGTRTHTNCGEKTPLYLLYVNSDDTRRFAKHVDLVLAYKQERCNEILESKDGKVKKTYRNLNTVRLEEIVALDEVASSHEFVYDLTVAETRNMTATNGLGLVDTFHAAGIADKNVTLGIPRFKECVDASKSPKTPCVTLRFLEPYASSKEFAEYVANTLPLTRLGDVVAKSSVVYDPDPGKTVVEEDAWIVAAEAMLAPGAEGMARYVARFELQQETMRMRKLTPPMLRRMLRERLQGRAEVISSEANAVEWVVRIRFARVSEMATLGSLTGDQEAIICHRAATMLLDTVVISGHRDVSASNAGTCVRVEYRDGAPSPRDEYVVHAYGAFLMDAAALECLDWARCTSNDIWETYHNLGVEAAAHVLFDQIRSVVSFDGTYIDDKHMLMLVDTMCRSGSLMPLNRHGINRTDVSPLMRASFEETIDVLCDAAMFAETENARGCTTSIMTGQLAEFGSGSVKVLFRDDSAPESRARPARPRRVMRSTCRSHTVTKAAQVLEYVFGEARPTGTRPLSPVEDEADAGSVRRVRFRPSSPA